MKTFLKEITNDWKTEYKVPNHTYIFENNACVGYIVEGTTKQKFFDTPMKQFSKSNRKFKKLTKKEVAELVWVLIKN